MQDRHERPFPPLGASAFVSLTIAAKRLRSKTSPLMHCASPAHVTFTRRQAIAIFSLTPPALLCVDPARASETTSDQISFDTLPCPEADCRPVQFHDYRVGTGKPVEQGSTIVFKWTGRLADRYGWPIQNEDADEIRLTLGTDRLIKGFEMAIMGMREGGKRRMLIPAELGYLDQKMGPLPASYGDRRRLYATVLNQRRFKRAGDLVIDVQLLKVRSGR